MCSLFEMENYEGDLTDIVRGGRRSSSSSYGCKSEDHDYPFSSSEESWKFSSQLLQEHDQYSFGDPFCAAAMRDPLLQELDMRGNTNNSSSSSSSSSAAFFNGSDRDRSGCGGSVFGVNSQQLVVHEDELIKRPSNLFSRMLQISPATVTTSQFPIRSDSSPSNLLIPSDLHHFVDNNNNPAALHISSPRNPPGIKRRKSQARKVVCVPAPVAASSRPNGEVIPSDLWAWRKYGQKPIKGSPYPRGYYRCSSSKGCSARKQVERSRTDPNMLVITYTSEHNHPWPTQRNALAGSSRSQQSKNSTTPNSSKLSSSTPQPQKPPTTIQDHDQGPDKNKDDQNNNNNNTGTTRSSSNNNVKEEAVEEIEKQFDTEEHHGDYQFSEGFQYKVATGSNNNNQSDDFFADLEELETDPLALLFTQGQKLDQSKGGGGLDDVVAFNNPFDWPAAENNNNSTSFEEQEQAPATASKRGFY